MAPDVSGGLKNSSSSSSSSSASAIKSKHALKKGPWTTSEDMILVEYVKKHGEGNWNAVQRNSGLMRCGKSCRLRWANHLRPNLKKGAFSSEEERLIVELHAKLGNKWARMAAQLPGRTDNEIKNYWNTRLKRRQRAGLPIYPQEVVQLKQQPLNSSRPPSFSSLLASSQPPNPNPIPLYDSVSPPEKNNRPDNTPYINHQLKLYQANNGNLAVPVAASNSPFSSSALPAALPFFNQRLSNPLAVPSLFQYNSMNYGMNDMGGLGLPSIQSPAQGAVTPAASSSDFVVATTSSDGAEDYEVERRFSKCSNSGLLEDLFAESQAVACAKPDDPFIAAVGNNVHEKAVGFGFGFGCGNDDENANGDHNYEGLETKAPGGGIASVEDDLLNQLLDNFPLSVPIPDWNGDGRETSISNNGTTSFAQSQPHDSMDNPVAASGVTGNQDWNIGSRLWNNMPSIY